MEPSPLEGFAVLRSTTDSYVCRDGFTEKVADSTCKELGFPTSHNYSFTVPPFFLNVSNWTKATNCPQNSRSVVYCPWTSTECTSQTAVKLRCREPGFLGCYLKPSSSQGNDPFQGLARHNVETEMECAFICRVRRQIADVHAAVVHQGACICVSSETLDAISSPLSYRFIHRWSCPRMAELNSRPTVYNVFSVSNGFCDQLDIVRNGKWDSNITWLGSIVNLNCYEGYVINGGATLQCVGLPGRSTYFPVWNSTMPSCEAIETPRMFCDHPGDVSNGEWNSTATSLGSSLTLTCDDSYVINGSATLFCMTSPHSGLPIWNASSVPTCQAMEIDYHAPKMICEHPGNVSNGEWNSTVASLGSSITLTCDDSYVINGSATLFCMTSPDSGLPTWNASSVPTCQAMETEYHGNETECEQLDNVLHGKWDSNTTHIGSIVRLDCDEGYVLYGDATLFCMASSDDGRISQLPIWNASTPTCEEQPEEDKSEFPLLLISLLASSLTFITLLTLITAAWCIYRRRYKRCHNPTQTDGDITGIQPTVTVNHSTSAAFSLYTLVPPVNHTISAEGYPVPAGAEDSAFDQDHIYQDAEDVRGNVTEMQRSSDIAVSGELSRYHGSSTAHLMLTSEQSLGAQHLLGTLPRKPPSGVEECEYDKLDITGIDNVTPGRGTATKQVCLFDPTEYNSLESARGPASSCMSKRAESVRRVLKTYTKEEERTINFPLNGQSEGTLEWNAFYGSSEYDNIDAANPTEDEGKLTMFTNNQPTSDNIFVEDSMTNTTNSPACTVHHPSTTDEVLYDQVDSNDPDDITVNQAPQSPSAFDSDDYSLLNSFRDYPRQGCKCDKKRYDSENEMAVNSTVTARTFEELYTKVQKQRGGRSMDDSTDGHQDTSENENGAKTAVTELYANVDKREEKLSNEASSVYSFRGEELYAKVSDQPSEGNGFIDGQQCTSENENDTQAVVAELYAKVDKREQKLPNEARSVSSLRREELYAKVSKQRDGPSKGNDFTDGHQCTTDDENDAETAPVQLYVNFDKKGGNI